MIEQFSKNWAFYTAISFLTIVATTAPITRVGIVILILAYLLYGINQVFVTRSNLEMDGGASEDRSLWWAISFNGADFIYLAVAVIIGIYLGLK